MKNTSSLRPACRAALAASVLLAVAGAQTPTTRDIATHVLNRLGHGPTPALLAQLTTLPAISSYITSQLNPVNPQTDNNLLQLYVSQLGLPSGQDSGGSLFHLVSNHEVRALVADAQLNERMTWFWNNHFNRSLGKIQFYSGFVEVDGKGEDDATWFMLQDDAFFREKALGNFHDLLRYAAGSVPMLIYLDNYLNTATQPNQNWGRELLELFTMGQIDASTGQANYVQQDVIAAAKCFTGWTVTGSLDNHSALIPTTADPNHDTSQKTLFVGTPHAKVILAGGTAAQDGYALLDHLTAADATKDFMVRKLMRFFLSETAPEDYPAILANAKAAWGTRGNIKQVLNAILSAPTSPLLTAADRWQKVKNPLHYAISMARSVGAVPENFVLPGGTPTPHIQHLLGVTVAIELMGQPLYHFVSPDGYPDENDAQISVSGYADRVDLAGSFLLVGPNSLNLAPELVVLNAFAADPSKNPDNPTHVADFLLHQFFADKPLNPGDLGLVVTELGTLDSTNYIAYATAVRTACVLIYTFTHASLF